VRNANGENRIDELIDLVFENRSRYSYPRFRIEVHHTRGELEFGDHLRGTFLPDSGHTDQRLDIYHFALLRSGSPSENLAGLASVVYWGFATYGDNYARTRARRLLKGYGARQAVTPDIASDCIAAARTDIEAGRLGHALGRLGPLCQLSRTPFASKVIAFLSPDVAGVYDQWIQWGLLNHPVLVRHSSRGGLFEGALSGVGSVSSVRVQDRYESWCHALRLIAAKINNELGTKQVRAVDVERSLFAAIAAYRGA